MEKMTLLLYYEVSFKQQYFDDTDFALTEENIQEVTKRQMYF